MQKRIGDQYNIAEVIVAAANARPSLDATATGGGLDYIVRYLYLGKKTARNSDVPLLVLGCQDDAGSPDKLDEPSTVTLYLEESWCENYFCFNFDTATQALDWMAAFQSADFAGFKTDEAQLCEAIQKLAQSTKAASYEYPGYVETGKWAWGYEGTRIMGNTMGAQPETVMFYRYRPVDDAAQILMWLGTRG
jgi:hypothetical protein